MWKHCCKTGNQLLLGNLFMNVLKHVIRKGLLFLLCGSIYYCLELIYRHYSHISMFILAGLLGVFFIDTPNNVFGYDLDYLIQIFISIFFCTIGEGITGYIVNIKMELNVWDYSTICGSFFYNQCNIFFVGIWALLIAFIGIPFCDAYNYYICKDETTPYYKILGKLVFRFPSNKIT